ncbi:MAG: hypothetical protein EXS14_01790 [Planctomycetes bacterium]|nr:hypothetical protein [Planctomycetota bacterium]
MRQLLSLMIVAFATNLICSGIYTEAQAKAAHAALGPRPPEAELARIASDFPYTATAVAARGALLERWIDARRAPEAQPFDDRLFDQLRASFTETPPYAAPGGAAVLGVLLLIFTVFLPGTRLRGMAVLGTLIAVLLLTPGFLQPGFQANLVGRELPLVRSLLAQFPRIALWTIIFAGVMLVLPRRGASSGGAATSPS